MQHFLVQLNAGKSSIAGKPCLFFHVVNLDWFFCHEHQHRQQEFHPY